MMPNAFIRNDADAAGPSHGAAPADRLPCDAPALRIASMAGRRSIYTAEIAERILQQLSGGRRLAGICGDPGMPSPATVKNWVRADRDGFAARYRQARNSDKRGPPSLYTDATAERILRQLSGGRTLAAICGDPGMPAANTVWQWLRDDRQGFAARFLRARKTGGAKGGGPTVYHAVMAEWILNQLRAGRTLADICRDPGMPVPSTVRNWADQDREGFSARYRTAREIGYEMMADQNIDIAEDFCNQWRERCGADGETEFVFFRRGRLRCTARQWLLSKALPRNYGNRPNLMARLAARDIIAELRRQIGERDRAQAKPESIGGKHG
jgi:transposase-like protein